MLKPGDKAPGFELPDADMEIVRLDDYSPGRNVVLYFYVRDDTPGCTAEAIEFSDLEAEFAALDCVVLGVSRDDCISHGVFRDKHGISVRLLADKECLSCRVYEVLVEREVDGVMRTGVQRSTFVIDRQGIVRHALYGVAAKGHAEEVLNLVKEL
ncbi:MAG: peroxiredoxin [Gallionellaceae bacterium]|nr:peroxiredoxin [Gallionellaceae bacterium]